LEAVQLAADESRGSAAGVGCAGAEEAGTATKRLNSEVGQPKAKGLIYFNPKNEEACGDPFRKDYVPTVLSRCSGQDESEKMS
jgi:nitrogenase subunit NifH